MSGKGDSPRPVNGDIFRMHFDTIFRQGKQGKRALAERQCGTSSDCARQCTSQPTVLPHVSA